MAGNVFLVGVNMDVLVSSLCLFIVVGFTIFFESGVHFLEKWVKESASDITSKVFMEVIQKLYKELMILGVISFILTLLLQMESITNQDHVIAFEWAHFVIFFVALGLIIQALSLTYWCYVVKKASLKCQSTALDEVQDKVEPLVKSGKRLPMMLIFQSVFKLWATVFVQSNQLPSNFNFAAYYCMIQDDLVVETMDIDTTSWLVFMFLIFMNVIVQRYFLAADVSTAAESGNSTAHVRRQLSAARHLGGNSGNTEPAVTVSRVMQFCTLGWILVGGSVIGLLFARRIINKIMRGSQAFVEQKGGTYTEILAACRRKYDIYRDQETGMSQEELKAALKEVELQKTKAELEKANIGVRGVTTAIGAVNKIATDALSATAKVATDLSATAKVATDVLSDSAKATTSMAFRRGSQSFLGMDVGDRLKLRRSSEIAAPKVVPVSTPEDDILPTSVSLRADGKPRNRRGKNRSRSLTRMTWSKMNSMSSKVNKTASAKRREHIDILQTGKSASLVEGENRFNLITPLELTLFTKWVDMQVLLNCGYISVYVCTFAGPTPKLDDGVILSTVAFLAPVVNLLLLVPLNLLALSFISAVCALNVDALGAVLEQGDELDSLMLDVQAKIVRKLTKQKQVVKSDSVGRNGKKRRKGKNIQQVMEDSLITAFEELDVDDSGTLEKAELKQGLASLGIFVSQATFDRLFRALDTDQDETVDFEEFKRFVFQKNQDEDATKIELQIKKHLHSRGPDARKKYVRSLMHSLSMSFEESMHVSYYSSMGAIPWNARRHSKEGDRRPSAEAWNKFTDETPIPDDESLIGMSGTPKLAPVVKPGLAPLKPADLLES